MKNDTGKRFKASHDMEAHRVVETVPGSGGFVNDELPEVKYTNEASEGWVGVTTFSAKSGEIVETDLKTKPGTLEIEAGGTDIGYGLDVAFGDDGMIVAAGGTTALAIGTDVTDVDYGESEAGVLHQIVKK